LIRWLVSLTTQVEGKEELQKQAAEAMANYKNAFVAYKKTSHYRVSVFI
jgi:hypothetical protein